MRIFLGLLVLACCLNDSNAILKHLRVSLKPRIQPTYSTVKYLAPTVVLAGPLPATYARPTYTSHVSTYSVSLPYVAPPVAYDFPQVYESTYAVPGIVHAAPYAYHRPSETVYFEEHYHDHFDK